MNVLMLNYEFPPIGGGAANANRYMLREFAEMDGLSVDLVTSSADGDERVSFGDGIQIFKLDVGKRDHHHWTQLEVLRYAVRGYLKTRKLANRNDYDLVHAWFTVPSGVMAAGLGLPYLVALRGSDVPGYNERFELQYTVLKPIIRRTWRGADAVVANSEGLRDLALETLEMDIDVIPNGVDVGEFTPDHDRNEPMEVLCVSRLVERKGIRYLLMALADLDVELTLVGEGQRQAELEVLARDLEIDDRVSFEGYVPHDHLSAYYQAADVFVLPSFNEGMSNSLLEALAAGLPVIVTETGGTAELVSNNGFVVSKADAEAIETSLRRYLDDEALREDHGRASRRRAEKMSWRSVSERYVDLYNSIA